MVIKGDWKYDRHDKQQHEHALVGRPNNQQEKEAHDEDHELGRDHIREDRAHEKPILPLEKRHAGWTVMPDMKRLCDDSGFATGGTT